MEEFDREKYIQGIIDEVERIKIRNGFSLYRINDKLSDENANYVKSYLTNTLKFKVEMKKCARCNNLWDIIITF